MLEVRLGVVDWELQSRKVIKKCLITHDYRLCELILGSIFKGLTDCTFREFVNQVFRCHQEFTRLARFGANILDAHSCFIFLPEYVLAQLEGYGCDAEHNELLSLVGAHSLSKDYIADCKLSAESGLIGWVARHGRSIHVSPFEHDSRTLGTYSADQSLKSFLGIPISLQAPLDGPVLSGVICCDSKKAFAFSKLQGKLLEELAEQAQALMRLAHATERAHAESKSFERFTQQGETLLHTLGSEAVEALRLTPANFGELERNLGLGAATQLLEQVYRLFQQALPPHTPICQLPTGELLCLVDNMMTSFYESRMQALAEHTVSRGMTLRFDYQRSGTVARRGGRKGEVRSLREILADTQSGKDANIKDESRQSSVVGLFRKAL